MKYRIGTHKDFSDIEDVIASTEYYGQINPTLLDGTWVVAEDDEGQIVGCVWVMHHKRSAYIDYLCVVPRLQHIGIGVRLMVKLRQVLKRRGIKYVRGCVKLDNAEALRLDMAMGGLVVGTSMRSRNDSDSWNVLQALSWFPLSGRNRD